MLALFTIPFRPWIVAFTTGLNLYTHSNYRFTSIHVLCICLHICYVIICTDAHMYVLGAFCWTHVQDIYEIVTLSYFIYLFLHILFMTCIGCLC